MTESSWLVPISAIAPEDRDVEKWGRRGVALLQALQLGLPVGEAWIIPADRLHQLIDEQLPPEHGLQSLLKYRERERGKHNAARAHIRLKNVPLPAELTGALKDLSQSQGEAATWGFSVWPSLTLNDVGASAMAASPPCLGVVTPAALEAAVREVWSQSVFEGALAYVGAQNIKDFSVALLLRPMRETQERGAMLTRTRPGAERSIFRQPGAWGVPRAGFIPQDLVSVQGTKAVHTRLQPPKSRAVAIEGHGRSAQIRDQALSRLGEEHLNDLRALCSKVEEGLSSPRWVEYALDVDGGLRVTDLFEPGPSGCLPGGPSTTLWSNLPVGELLPSVPTPVTRGVAADILEEGAREAVRDIGVKVPRGTQLLTSARGRFFVNLSALGAAGTSLLGSQSQVLAELGPEAHWEEVAVAPHIEGSMGLVRFARLAARMLFRRGDLAAELADFRHDAAAEQRWFRELDLGILPDDALKTTLRETHAFAVRVGRMYLRSSIDVLVAHVTARTFIGRFLPDHDLVSRVLLAAVGDLETLKAPAAAARLAADIRRDPQARRDLRGGVSSLTPRFRARFDEILSTHAMRGVNEMELATPRFGEEPAHLEALVQALVRTGVRGPDRALSDGRVMADRDLAEADVLSSLLTRGLVRRTRDQFRQLLRMREVMRVAMAEALGTVRTVVLDIDRRLRRIDPSLPVGAAFFCDVEELMWAAGRSGANFGDLVRMRMHERACQKAFPDPRSTCFGAPPRHVPPLRVPGRWSGSGSGSGIAIGPARIIGPGLLGLSELNEGEIPVVRALELGLSSLVFSAPAVVAQSGGPTSHGLLLAQEVATPAVVAADRVLETVTDGMLLRVDSDKGVVGRVQRE